MGNFLVTQSRRRKYRGELCTSFTTPERSIDTLFLAVGYDAWVWNKQSKQWWKLIFVCIKHT